MIYNFDRIVCREGSSCMKYDKREEIFGCGNVIPMWIADMDFEVAPFISEAIKNRAEHAVFGYDFRCEVFHDAVKGWIDRRNGWQIEHSWINCTPGVVAGIVFGLLAFSNEGDGVVIQPPVYPPFAATIQENGRRVVNNPMKFNGRTFEIDFEDLDRKLEGSKILLFCNPHNPTGRVFTKEELLKVGELCKKHDVVIISDEIHSDFAYEPHHHIHIASLTPDLASRTVTLLAPSKTFNIAGLCTSAAIISDEKLRAKYAHQIERLHVNNGNTFGNRAFEAAYKHGDEWVDQVKTYLYDNAKYAMDFIRTNIPTIKFSEPEGTFLLWLDFSDWGLGQRELMDFLIGEAKLGLNNGLEFGREGAGCARMNLGAPRSVVEQALSQLKSAYDKRFK